jgi:hypothetical protein
MLPSRCKSRWRLARLPAVEPHASHLWGVVGNIATPVTAWRYVPCKRVVFCSINRGLSLTSRDLQLYHLTFRTAPFTKLERKGKDYIDSVEARVLSTNHGILGIKAEEQLHRHISGTINVGVVGFTLVQANCLLTQARTNNRHVNWTKGHKQAIASTGAAMIKLTPKLRAKLAPISAVLGTAFPSPS